MDYYKVLQLKHGASPDDIRNQYRKLAKKYHPDTNAGNTLAQAYFLAVKEAFQVLSDPESREAYDQLNSEERKEKVKSFKHWPQRDFDAPAYDESFREHYGGFFGEGAQDFWQQYTPAHRHYFPLEMDLRMAFEGGQVVLESGEALDIPAGTPAGSLLPHPSRPQDLFEVSYTAPEPFEVEGYDLLTHYPVFEYEAILGEEKELIDPLGERRLFKVPQGSQNEDRIAIPGAGLPMSEGRGILWVQLELMLSSGLSEQERALLIEFRALRRSKQGLAK